MHTLGIETSCDETSAAVVSCRKVLSCETLSSLKQHRQYGGIIPEIASRRHLQVIDKVTQSALEAAGINIAQIDLIAVTTKPGLIGSLLVGKSFAAAVSYSADIPLIPINHIQAHLFAPFLNKTKVKLPFIGLVVSGGHTGLYLVSDFDDIKLISKTKDDAAGEALDKVGRLYGLGYPAGPAIDRLYNPGLVDKTLFTINKQADLSFSFSGIKTKAAYIYRDLAEKKRLNKQKRTAILSSFQYTVINSLINNLTQSLKQLKIKRVVLGGGVAANRLLRESLISLSRKESFELLVTDIKYCQDNAAFIGGLGEYLQQRN